jgi:hypothetical protein
MHHYLIYLSAILVDPAPHNFFIDVMSQLEAAKICLQVLTQLVKNVKIVKSNVMSKLL